MNNTQFSLWNLFPDFRTLFDQSSGDPDALSAFFVLSIWVLLLLFLLQATYAFFKSRSQVNFFHNLIKPLSQENLAEARRELAQKAMNAGGGLGKLWREFDESLVYSDIKPNLRNTLDASHFFSTRTLSRTLTENRLMAAVPGFLTAFGVIGTFVGLSLGLKSLELNGNAGVDALQAGIKNMITGASIAFITSVWGIIASVVFNFYEKILERLIRSRIFSLQNEIDYLYPRITAEQSLVNIAETGKNTDEAIQGLAEKVGDKMQEALTDVTRSISSSLEQALNDIMQPAIQSLVSNANGGAQQAVEGLINRFMDGMGEAGKHQQAAMNDASEKVSDAVNSMGGQINGFLDKFEGQASQLNSVLSEQFSKIESREQERSSNFESQLDMLVSKNREIIQHVSNDIEGQWELQKEQEITRQAELRNTVNGFQEVQSNLINEVGSLLSQQQQNATALLTKIETVESKLEGVATANHSAAKELNGATQNMNAVSNQLGTMSVKVQEAAQSLGGLVDKSTESMAHILSEYQSMMGQIEAVTSLMEDAQKNMVIVSSDLKQAAEHADSGFNAVDQHLNNFSRSLGEQVKVLEEQAANLLSDYAEKVSAQTASRMSEWNKQTSEYSNSMTQAVRAIQAVVDEIESKTGRL